MKFFVDLITLFLVFFIKIGDAVIFLVNLILNTVKKILKAVLKGVLISLKLKPKINAPKIRIFTPQKSIPVKEIKPEQKISRINLDLVLYPFKKIKNNISFFSGSKIKEIYKEKRKKHDQVFKKHKKQHSPASLFVKVKYFIAGTFFSLIFAFLPLLFLIFLQDLPNPRELTLRQIPQTTKIYDRNGTLLYQIYTNQNRTIVPLDSMPKNLKNATIAIEDKDFYKHPGFNVLAIGRSFITNVSGTGFQGGSTLTQQLIKSALLTPETSITRKVKEAILAFWAERIYSKNQILEMYLNQVPYGGTAWGVEAASEVYFGKKVSDLDLAQSAFLAGIPKAPTIYSPYGQYPNLWKKRQKEVLKRMTDLGYVSQKQANDAYSEELDFKSPQTPIYAPHFVMYVKDYLVKRYGLSAVERGGLTVITSLDLKTQENTEKIVAQEVQNDTYLNLTNGAALITNPKNGDILAMVGSRDYHDPKDGNFNVTTSFRQPGSSIKVVTYSAALSNGLTAASIIDDSPVVFTGSNGAPSYAPVNYDGQFHGRVTIRTALANSFNIPAVKILNQIGIPTMVNFAQKMGITSWDNSNNYGLSITLGAAEATMTDMATVYGTLANQGVRVEPNPILKATDYTGNVLEEKNKPSLFGSKENQYLNGIRVMDQGVAFIMASILSDNQSRAIEFGTNSPLNIPGHTISVKTGTSDNKRDNWTIGYNPNYVVTVWVGNNDNSPMSQSLASGITGAAPIWNKIMTSLIGNTPDIKYPMPNDVIQKQCNGKPEYFIKGTENSVNCNYIPTPSISPTKKP